MSDSERRYGPTIDLQGFDLRTDMDAVNEPSRLPLVVAIALVVLVAFAGVVWLAYTQGVQRGRDSVSRELTAQEFWKLRKPAAPAYTGLKIYEPPGAAEANAKPATPVKRQAANIVPSLRPTASAAPDIAASTQGAAPKPVDANQSPPEFPESKRATAAVSGEGAPQRVATHAPTVLTKPDAAPTPLASHPITEPESFSAAPATGSAAPPAAKKVASIPPAAPAAQPKVTAPPPAAPVSVPTTEAASKEAYGILLQIGSYKSNAEARTSWQAFKSEHDAAAGYQPDVKQVDLGAKGTWYRLRMGPFTDKKSALETCRKLKADGASCLVAQ